MRRRIGLLLSGVPVPFGQGSRLKLALIRYLPGGSMRPWLLVYLGRTNWFLVEYQLAGTESLETQASAAHILARIRLDWFGFWLLSFTAYFFWIFTVVRDFKDLG
jgi:hypothetical protein